MKIIFAWMGKLLAIMAFLALGCGIGAMYFEYRGEFSVGLKTEDRAVEAMRDVALSANETSMSIAQCAVMIVLIIVCGCAYGLKMILGNDIQSAPMRRVSGDVVDMLPNERRYLE